MNKIASPQDLQNELTRLVAYCSEGQPSREKVASELRSLADRLAGKTPSSPNEAWDAWVGDQSPKEFMRDADTDDPAKAVKDYVAQLDSMFGKDETKGLNKRKLSDLLVRHIEKNVR